MASVGLKTKENMAPSRPPVSSLRQTTLDTVFRRGSTDTTTSKQPDENRISKKPRTTRPTVQPKPTAAAGSSARVLTDVLLAIKPIHLANIVSRQKNHEYRNYRLRDGVTRLWLYETGDNGRGRAAITYAPLLFRFFVFAFCSVLVLALVLTLTLS